MHLVRSVKMSPTSPNTAGMTIRSVQLNAAQKASSAWSGSLQMLRPEGQRRLVGTVDLALDVNVVVTLLRDMHHPYSH